MRPVRTYGKLKLCDGHWELSQLEPHVAIRLKQLFPKIPKQSPGPFHFANDAITSADLDWFTSRYPFQMSEKDRESLTSGRLAFEFSQAERERILLPSFIAPKYLGLKQGKALRNYQGQAVELIRSRRRLMIGDEGGLGKTVIAAGFLASEPQALPAAVVCDPHMQRQWLEKLSEFTHLQVHVIKKARPYELPPAQVYIFRISQIGGWSDIFATGFFKAVIYDEPQSLRTGEVTSKGAAARVLTDNSQYAVGLSATPIYNYGVEVWSVMSFIDPSALGAFEDFKREWVDHNDRINDPKALGTYLREQHAMIRRLKSDVGLELPKVSRIVEYVDYDQKTVDSIEELAKRLAIKASTGSFVERGQAIRELDMMVRQATGLSKAKAVAQFVRLLVEAGESVLLLGWHRSVYDIWLRELADLDPAMYTGSESASKKNAEISRFKSGSTKIMIMSLRSGAGVDGLQHVCSTVVFGELDWSPGVHAQIIWRVDRDCQPDPVTAFFLVSDEGSDPPIMDVLGIKASEATQIVDPHLGVQIVDDDTTPLQRLVDRYLTRSKVKATQKLGFLPQQIDSEKRAGQETLF